MIGALENITVLDLTRVLAGPYCTMILADLGAEVIKIENPDGGDDSRAYPPFVKGESGYFISLNRNKKSVVLDLKSDQGKAIFKKLVAKADVVVENFRPGTMKRLGLGYNELRKINEKIIYAAISGFGQDGPYSQKPAYDLIVQGMGGVMGLTAHPGGEPTRVGAAIGDIAAGMYTAIGILSAVHVRNQTGKGQMIDVSMLDCQVALIENAIARYNFTGKNPEPTGNRHPSIAPFQCFPTQNGRIIAAAGNENLWKRFCKALDAEDLLENEMFSDNGKRVKNVMELQEILFQKFNKRTTEEWIEILEGAGIPCGPINTVQEVIHDSQIRYREMIVEMEHPVVGKYLSHGLPIKMSNTPSGNMTPAPVFGQHQEEILEKYFAIDSSDDQE